MLVVNYGDFTHGPLEKLFKNLHVEKNVRGSSHVSEVSFTVILQFQNGNSEKFTTKIQH